MTVAIMVCDHIDQNKQGKPDVLIDVIVFRWL